MNTLVFLIIATLYTKNLIFKMNYRNSFEGVNYFLNYSQDLFGKPQDDLWNAKTKVPTSTIFTSSGLHVDGGNLSIIKYVSSQIDFDLINSLEHFRNLNSRTTSHNARLDHCMLILTYAKGNYES